MMPSPMRYYGKGEEKTTKKRRSVIPRSNSFDVPDLSSRGGGGGGGGGGYRLQRPRTVPDLVAISSAALPETNNIIINNDHQPKKLTKLLLNVTIQRSIGAVHLLMSPESTAGDIIASAVNQYVRDGRRPRLLSTNPVGFDLHYSQFCLESLKREEKLEELGSRNFFVCPKRCTTTQHHLLIQGDDDESSNNNNVMINNNYCSNETQTKPAANVDLPSINFMFSIMKYSV